MSLTLFFCMAACAATAGWIAGKRVQRFADDVNAEEEAELRNEPVEPLAAFPFGLGDVLIHTRSDEALLSCAHVLTEGGEPVAAVFVGPGERGKTRVVVAFPQPCAELLWLSPVEGCEIGPEAPSALDLGATVFSRKQRLPVFSKRFGNEGPSHIVGEIIFARYESGARDVAIVLQSEGGTFIAKGERLPIAFFDHLPGQRLALDERGVHDLLG